MDERSIKIVNRIYKVVMCAAAAAMAIGALKYNPGHLITAGAILVAGLEGEIVKKERE